MSHSAESDAHVHKWVRRQNVTTKGTVMPAYEACACGAARYALVHHCPSCTCPIPPGLPTCPSECAETNHPGMEHEEWLPPETEAAVMRVIEVVRPHWDDDTRPISPEVGQADE